MKERYKNDEHDNKQIIDISVYSGKTRYILLVLSSLLLFTASGIVFGWTALQMELENENAFLYLCEHGEKTCPKQISRLNLVYTIGAFTSTGSAFLTGVVYDRFGPRKTNFLSFLLLVLGCLVWYVSYMFEQNLYILAFALIGTGGPACQISLLHICNLFPNISSAISTSFSGMFVGSSIVFKVFSVIATRLDIPVSYVFLGYMISLVPIFIPTWILLKDKPFIPITDFKIQHGINIIDESKQNQSINQALDESKGNMFSNVRERPVLTQIFSKEFILICFYMSINSLHCVYYMGVVNEMFSNNQLYIDIFNYMWSGGVFLIPIVGFIMVKTTLHMNCFIVNASGIIFGVLAAIPIDHVQLGAFGIVSFTNVSLWAFYFIYLSDVFGNNNYGKLMGLSSIVTAVVGLLEYLFVYLNNFTSITYSDMNIALTIAKIPCFILVYLIWKENKKKFTLYSPVLQIGDGGYMYNKN